VKGWYAVVPALLLLFPRGGTAAENPNDAAREMARRVAASAGPRDAVALVLRSIGQSQSGDELRLRPMLESALREAGVRLDPAGPVELRITVSETPARRLLVGEARRGDERQTWIVSWPSETAPATAGATAAARLDGRLLWEQAEPVLDASLAGDSLIVLSPSRIAVLERSGAAWEPRRSAALVPPRPWPRDPRARLSVSGSSVRVLLPGGVCAGAWQPSLALDCRASDEPWPVDSGGPHLLLGGFAAGRNHFDGRVTTQAGTRKSVPPFYSAAAVEESGEALWIFAGLDGRAVLTDRAFVTVATLGVWGSDLAGAGVRCHGRTPLLATRPGQENDAIQAFTVANGQAETLAPALPMPGPVTALWPAPGGAIAVARDAATEKYAVYLVTIACGQ
jgi:hypothetical protein